MPDGKQTFTRCYCYLLYPLQIHHMAYLMNLQSFYFATAQFYRSTKPSHSGHAPCLTEMRKGANLPPRRDR
jgi:hypothetical protein